MKKGWKLRRENLESVHGNATDSTELLGWYKGQKREGLISEVCLCVWHLFLLISPSLPYSLMWLPHVISSPLLFIPFPLFPFTCISLNFRLPNFLWPSWPPHPPIMPHRFHQLKLPILFLIAPIIQIMILHIFHLYVLLFTVQWHINSNRSSCYRLVQAFC